MKKIVLGILAHVDAGKTTLSESMLYHSGKIRRLGRVDNMDAYLDTYDLEKARGITIFSKQAVFQYRDTEMILVDTPGHVDFSAEMERTLQVLDYAVLVISGADGIQGHTKTLWNLLKFYRIPTMIFVNKMDQVGTEAGTLLNALKIGLSDGCILFNEHTQLDTLTFNPVLSPEALEQVALCDESAMNQYLETGGLDLKRLQTLIQNRSVFPVFFGSALRQMGVQAFMEGFDALTLESEYPVAFGAKVFKISRDPQGNRLSHLKITGGKLSVRDLIQTEAWEEKVNQIRIYSGDKFEPVSAVAAGSICAVTGLTLTRAGEGLGFETAKMKPILEPVLSYSLMLPEGTDSRLMMGKLKQLEEEIPEIKLFWNEVYQEIEVQMMGEVQIEVLQAMILNRFEAAVGFGEGKIVYKETLGSTVEGVGHFEPLRHYAEVHLLMEPAERGSGLAFESNVSEDVLDKNWQRLILSHLKEKTHLGVLTGSPVTDLKVILVAGKAHERHTEGGDFREATYRALRHGLKSGVSVLLEPYYDYRLELPAAMVGRAMMDLDHMQGSCEIAEQNAEDAVLVGTAPVSAMRNYHREVIAYTKGHGRLTTSLGGYGPCLRSAEVIEAIGYDSERDLENPTGSVFCTHGSGFTVHWSEVTSHMHLEAYLKAEKPAGLDVDSMVEVKRETENISLEEIDAIMNSTFYANTGRKGQWKKPKSAQVSYYESLTTPISKKMKPIGTPYLLVDGYNIIFAWEDLNAIAAKDLESARIRLLEILSNYQGMNKGKLIVVFDAYRVAGRRESVEAYHNIHVVYTGEAQTADQYIEKFAHDHSQKNHVTVATSDGLQQMIIRGAGCDLLSARDLKFEVDRVLAQMKEEHLEPLKTVKNTLESALSSEALEALKKKF